jgi:hypothetical protein
LLSAKHLLPRANCTGDRAGDGSLRAIGRSRPQWRSAMRLSIATGATAIDRADPAERRPTTVEVLVMRSQRRRLVLVLRRATVHRHPQVSATVSIKPTRTGVSLRQRSPASIAVRPKPCYFWGPTWGPEGPGDGRQTHRSKDPDRQAGKIFRWWQPLLDRC